MSSFLHAQHVGSLLRPQSLVDARAASQAGNLPQADLQKIEHTAIRDIVTAQLSHGITPITTGEYERFMFSGGFFENLSGMTLVTYPPYEKLRMSAPSVASRAAAGEKVSMSVFCTGKIEHVQSPYLEDWLYLRSLVPQESWNLCKITMPSPETFHIVNKPGCHYPKEVYPDDDAFFKDQARAYQKEIDLLYQAGLRSIQVDCPWFSFFCDQRMLDGTRAEGVDPDALLDTYIRAHNECLRGRPKDMDIGVHICRGNAPGSRHFATGSYDRIARKLFNDLDYDTFYLEYDTPRAGGFEPLRYLPSTKNVVLGLVSSKVVELEDPEVLKSRVLEAADIIAEGQGRSREEVMRRIGISPQCGFASMSPGGGVGFTRGIMVKKLELVRDVARELWPEG